MFFGSPWMQVDLKRYMISLIIFISILRIQLNRVTQFVSPMFDIFFSLKNFVITYQQMTGLYGLAWKCFQHVFTQFL